MASERSERDTLRGNTIENSYYYYLLLLLLLLLLFITIFIIVLASPSKETKSHDTFK